MLPRIVTWLALVCATLSAQIRLERGEALPDFPDPAGRAGMAAATVRLADGSEGLLIAGGANFPGRAPWNGGEKVFYADIVLLRKVDGEWKWEKVGDLPEPVAYAAFAPCKEGLVIAGGANASGHLAAVRVVTPEGKVSSRRPLPTTLAYAACASENDRLYVIGGQATPDATMADPFFGVLDLKDPAPSWEVRPWLANGRILATAGVLDGKLILAGGCSLKAGPDGKPQRTYLRDTRVFRVNANPPDWESASVAGPELPFPLAAACGPAVVRESRVVLLGGDDGSHYGKPPQDHPGQRDVILAIDPRAGTVAIDETRLAVGCATAPAVVLGSDILVVSGETKPGVRTPAMQRLQMSFTASYGWVDFLMAALATAAIGLIGWQATRGGLRRTLGSLGDANRPTRAAWVAVGLLFVVAMLNYLDRQLLASMSAPIMRDIPQSSAQFGLLTAIFLFVYSALSPVGGILADRYSRRMVILVSLAVWSAVTWLTGHVTDYRSLVVARALMGVSEAFYIPAALALITDYHRGRTRSLATGIHMSGIYIGQALAGLGGFVAQYAGWRMTFGIFGLVGVIYALVLIVWLREPTGDAETPLADAGAGDKPGVLEILGGCVRVRAFWMLFAIMACASASNWFILSWLPRLLQENFNLSMGEAGTWATLPSSIAKYLAVIGGAILADRWSARDPGARSRLAAIAFLVAGPMIALTTVVPEGALAVFVGLVLFQGLAQGVLDANLMAILRSHIGGRFAATGYGFLNLAGAGIGGLTVYYGGALKDAGTSLATTLAFSGAGLVACGLALAFLPRPSAVAD